MKFHENKKEFIEAIQATSEFLGIREVFVEKDYWVCFVLKNLSLSEFKSKVVFKGGTSLSKAHKAIHRFSEDVDLAIIAEGLSESKCKTLIKNVEKSIAKTPLKEISKEGATSKGSKLRKTFWSYAKASEGDLGDASPDLLIEINSFADPSPFSPRPIQTYLADFLISRGMNDEIEKYSLQVFDVNVLDITRTFAEKVAAVARASLESPLDHGELKKKIRHIYDLAMLLRIPAISDFVKNGEFLKLYEKVKAEDLNVSSIQAKHHNTKIKDIPIFNKTDEVLNALSSTYSGQFASLIYDTKSIPTKDELKSTVEIIKIQFLKSRKNS